LIKKNSNEHPDTGHQLLFYEFDIQLSIIHYQKPKHKYIRVVGAHHGWLLLIKKNSNEHPDPGHQLLFYEFDIQLSIIHYQKPKHKFIRVVGAHHGWLLLIKKKLQRTPGVPVSVFFLLVDNLLLRRVPWNDRFCKEDAVKI
jgi:hypothetical protein